MLDEARRLKTLKSYAILDTPPEPQFDDIALLASKVCETPIAIVSFADKTRHWYKARVGTDRTEIAVEQAVCAHAIDGEDFLVIEDLAADVRTRDLHIVLQAPHYRFYASVLLRTPNGQAIGTICVVDYDPRPQGLTPAQRDALTALARHAMALLWLRSAISAGRDGDATPNE